MSKNSHGLVACVAGLLLASVPLAAAGLWDVNIDHGPAPSPEDGPPLSYHASRDPSLLKYQVIGIVGGYVGAVLIIGLALLTVGKRARRAAQSSHGTLSVEMVKPSRYMLDTSPVSPNQSVHSWRRWGTKGVGSTKSPVLQMASSFDMKVIESDKARNQQEMERLYAAVMSQDSMSTKLVNVDENELDLGTGSYHSPSLTSPTAKSFPQRQPRLHLNTRKADPSQHVEPRSPRSPVRAIYPPHGPMPSDPTAATSTYPTTGVGLHQRHLPSSPASTRSQARHPSSASSRSNAGGSDRNLHVSVPIQQTYPDDDDIEAYTPVSVRYSPRYYPNLGRLPSPPLQTSHTYIEEDDDEEEDEDQVGEMYAYEGLDQPRPWPPPAPHRNISQDSDGPGKITQDYPPHTRPPQIQYPTQDTPSSTNNILPFRSLDSHATLPSPSNSFTPLSPPPTRTTYLDARRQPLYRNGMWSAGGPRTGGLTSAGLATPYSPYMPFTPVTPVTPHLTSRAERLQRVRDVGRTVATKEDEVIPEKDMWGDAW